VTTLAKAVSVLFHPLLLTTYLVVLLGWFMPEMLRIPSSKMMAFTAVVAVITGVLPALNLVLLKYLGSIRSLTMRERSERHVPFIMITVFYVSAAILFYTMDSLSPNFVKLLAIVSMLIVMATVITFFYKISIHSLAMWGAVGILLPLTKASLGQLIWPTALVIALTGLVMSARLYLQAHTPREVLYGALTGFGIGFLGMNVFF
jgi:membrane-associated phospholipid phosphatase